MNGKMETVGIQDHGQQLQSGNPTTEADEPPPIVYAELAQYFAPQSPITVANAVPTMEIDLIDSVWPLASNPPALLADQFVFQSPDETQLAYTFQGQINGVKFLVAIFAQNPDPENPGPIESPPTGIWIGTTSGGVPSS